VARKTVLVCDNCGNEIDEGKGASMRINYSDARRGSATTAPAGCPAMRRRGAAAGPNPSPRKTRPATLALSEKNHKNPV